MLFLLHILPQHLSLPSCPHHRPHSHHRFYPPTAHPRPQPLQACPRFSTFTAATTSCPPPRCRAPWPSPTPRSTLWPRQWQQQVGARASRLQPCRAVCWTADCSAAQPACLCVAACAGHGLGLAVGDAGLMPPPASGCVCAVSLCREPEGGTPVDVLLFLPTCLNDYSSAPGGESRRRCRLHLCC